MFLSVKTSLLCRLLAQTPDQHNKGIDGLVQHECAFHLRWSDPITVQIGVRKENHKTLIKLIAFRLQLLHCHGQCFDGVVTAGAKLNKVLIGENARKIHLGMSQHSFQHIQAFLLICWLPVHVYEWDGRTFTGMAKHVILKMR